MRPPPSSFMDTSAWMQVVERRLEQAAEDARSRPVARSEVSAVMPVCPRQTGM